MNEPCAMLMVPVRFMISDRPIATIAKNAPRTMPLTSSGRRRSSIGPGGGANRSPLPLGRERDRADGGFFLDGLLDEVRRLYVLEVEDVHRITGSPGGAHIAEPHRPHQLMVLVAIVAVGRAQRVEVRAGDRLGDLDSVG